MEELGAQRELISQWFENMATIQGEFKKPILDHHSISIYKEICDLLEQPSNVFIMSIEVSEDYIRAKKRKRQKIIDPFLAAATIIFICHKCEGGQESLKLQHILDILIQFTGKNYQKAEIVNMEGDIINALKGVLPVTTPLNDLLVIVEKYMGHPKIRGNVRKLCVKILEHVYFTRSEWFGAVEEIYSDTRDSRNVFKRLMSTKIYIPMAVLVTAIEITQYMKIMDLDAILSNVYELTQIHQDHIRVLSNKFIEILNE